MPALSQSQQRLRAGSIELDKIHFHERIFEFHKPVEFKFTQNADVWECEASGITSFGTSAQDAVLSFCEDFSVLWDQIAQAPDESLAKSAQRIKGNMLFVVKSIR
jgi:hypothetical protein